MAFHHVALATKDPAATHAFYTDVMGFSLVKVVAAPTPGGGSGWSKHFFYDTGTSPGMIAFWDIRDDVIGTAWKADLSESVGLPVWVNHLAFDAATEDDFELAKKRWLDHGMTVPEVDHGFCKSIYATDPNGVMVEWCTTLRPFTAEELAEAERLLHDQDPELEGAYPVVYHRPPR